MLFPSLSFCEHKYNPIFQNRQNSEHFFGNNFKSEIRRKCPKSCFAAAACGVKAGGAGMIQAQTLQYGSA